MSPGYPEAQKRRHQTGKYFKKKEKKSQFPPRVTSTDESKKKLRVPPTEKDF